MIDEYQCFPGFETSFLCYRSKCDVNKKHIDFNAKKNYNFYDSQYWSSLNILLSTSKSSELSKAYFICDLD